MSETEALSPIADDSHSSESVEAHTDAAPSFWPAVVAAHADAALDLLSALSIPDHSVAHDALQSVDRIRTNADAACADDLRSTQQHVHHAYAHAEHSPALAARVAALDAAAAWRLAQYLYEAHATEGPAIADIEHRLCKMEENARQQQVATAFELRFLHSATEGARQYTDNRVDALHTELFEQLASHIDARVARASLASFEMIKKHNQQIEDLTLAVADLQEKYEALKPSKSPTRKWSLFSSADATNPFTGIVQ